MTRPARIGISFDGFQPVSEMLATARQAAANGVRSVWMADHLGYREALTSCMALAAGVPDVTVVPTAISPFIRHPTPVAAGMATIAETNGGRAAIAIGSGNPLFLEESGAAIDKPVRAIRDFAQALRALWSGDPVRMDGLTFKLAGARLGFRPPTPIPVYIAAMKDQMLRLAGKIGDGVVLSGGLSPAFVEHSIKIVAEGAAEAGRDNALVERAGYVYFLTTASTRAGYNVMKNRLAFLMRNRYIDDNIAHSGLPIDQAAIIDAVARRDMDRAAALVPDEAVEAFSVTGTAAACRAGIERYRNAGLDEVVLVMAGEPADRELGMGVIREFLG